jgi:hypothetical protein
MCMSVAWVSVMCECGHGPSGRTAVLLDRGNKVKWLCQWNVTVFRLRF